MSCGAYSFFERCYNLIRLSLFIIPVSPFSPPLFFASNFVLRFLFSFLLSSTDTAQTAASRDQVRANAVSQSPKDGSGSSSSSSEIYNIVDKIDFGLWEEEKH